MADGSESTMSEGDPPMAAQVVSGHLEVPGHLEMTPGQSPMETDEPGARARRRADEAEIADRGTPPKRPPQPAGSEGHQEMPGHLEIPQEKKNSCDSCRGGRRTGEQRPRVRSQSRPRPPAAQRSRREAAWPARRRKPMGQLEMTQQPAAHVRMNRRTTRRGRRLRRQAAPRIRDRRHTLGAPNKQADGGWRTTGKGME